MFELSVLLKAIVNFAGFGSGIAAAVVWFMASRVKLPPMGTYWDQAPEGDPFFQALNKSSKLNAKAALIAAASATLMAIKFAYNF